MDRKTIIMTCSCRAFTWACGRLPWSSSSSTWRRTSALHVGAVVHDRPTLTFNPSSAATPGTGSRPAFCSSATASWTSSGCASCWARTWPYVLRLVLRRQPLRPEQDDQRRVRVRQGQPSDGGDVRGTGGVPGRARALRVRPGQAPAGGAQRRAGTVHRHGLPQRVLPAQQGLLLGVHGTVHGNCLIELKAKLEKLTEVLNEWKQFRSRQSISMKVGPVGTLKLMLHSPSGFKWLSSLAFMLRLIICLIQNINLNMQNYMLYFKFI
jgi:hypothetical protein